MHARLAAAVLVALALATTASASIDGANALRISFLPQKAFKGQPASLSVVVRPTGVRCTPTIRYANGAVQRLAPALARAGRATWKWTIPATARIGGATASVTCGQAGRVSRSFAVVGAPTAPAKVDVRKSGFSQRVRGTNREVSYGVVLHNPSPENDALDVVVLVNFVDATNRVVYTDSQRIEAIGAGTEYYLGSSSSIPDASPVSTLEIDIRIGGQGPKRKLSPAITDVLVQEARYDRGWVGAVVGQLTNDTTNMLMTGARISAVLFDGGGNVVGGARGATSAGQLPGIRAYFNASSGASAIPVDRAVSASVSALGRYEATS